MPPSPAPVSPDAAPPPRKSRLSLELLDNRYPSLHGLRVLAILSVVQFHVTWIFAGEQGIKLDGTFASSSLTIFFGMDLFFVLSGFLIGSILLRSVEVAGSQELSRFYLRRVLRTFPAYYLVLVSLVATTALTAAQRHHLPYEFVYLTNFMPLGRKEIVMFWGWSLALEEQFYLTVPLLFVALSRLPSPRARVVLLALLWAIAPCVRLAIFLSHTKWTDLDLYGALYFRSYTRFDALVAGVLLALVHRRWKVEITRWLEAPFHRALLGLVALTCLWLLLFPSLFGMAHVQLVHVFCWGTITSVMYFALLLLLLHGEGGVLRRALSLPLFRRIATLGYGIYLVHIPLADRVVLPLAHALDERHVSKLVLWPLSFVLLTALSLAVAYLLHLTVEKPSLWLRERLSRPAPKIAQPIG